MTADLNSFGYISLPASTGNHLLNESMLEWSRTSSCFYATSRVDEDRFSELARHNWKVIALGKHKSGRNVNCPSHAVSN